ncbi:MAG: excinuclease ABC subunit UvrA, partial [Succinivibrio sp.]
RGPGAEDLAFNSGGACKRCGGTGLVRIVDESTLVPDESLTIDEGAVLPWQTLMWKLMKDIARDLGVRTNVPFKDLTPRERDIVFHGPAVKHHMVYQNKTDGSAGEMDFTYFNATYTVENALSKVHDEKGMKRVERFLRTEICPDCHGTRLSEAARAPRLRGISLDEACTMPLKELLSWVRGVPGTLPKAMRPMADGICQSFESAARRLMDLGLGYLSLDRAASTLSTGERQRMQLARAVRNRTTGVLYVLDEPSIGLHPANIEGLAEVMDDLVSDGNSVVLVDHDTTILSRADWMIEMGPGAGASGGSVVAQGTISDIEGNPKSLIGPFLRGKAAAAARPRTPEERMFDKGEIRLQTGPIHTVGPLDVRIPKGRLCAVTGVSGSGKTTLVLESLVPAIAAAGSGAALPPHVKSIETGGITQAKLIDATPIGINVRSTVATYAGVHDELRRVFARTRAAAEAGLKAGVLSYNNGSLRCPECDGTGQISLDVQFLPDVDIECPECRGTRYSQKAGRIVWENGKGGRYSLPDLMAMSVDEALEACEGLKLVRSRLEVLHDLGLGYLRLGEETPGLSGGEAQRLKLASESGRPQDGALFVFDEPTIGLHPLDVRTLIGVFQSLIDKGASVVVIEHDLDMIRNADYIIDMGPGGGSDGGAVVACGTPEQVRKCPMSVTGRYI